MEEWHAMVPSPCTGEPTLPTTRRNGCFNPFYLVVYPIYWGYWDFFRWYMCKIVCNKIGSSYLLRLLRQVIYLQDISLYTKLKKKLHYLHASPAWIPRDLIKWWDWLYGRLDTFTSLLAHQEPPGGQRTPERSPHGLDGFLIRSTLSPQKKHRS